MPWSPRDAYQHTKKASTPEAQRIWAEVANKHLAATGDEAGAIRIANSAVANYRAPHIKPKARPSN
jgi:hypothetical protein